MATLEDSGTASDLLTTLNLKADNVVNMSNRGLTSLSLSNSGSLVQYAVILNLNENSFHQVPLEVCEIQGLEKLFMKCQRCKRRASFPGSNESLYSIPSCIKNLTHLRELDLSDNEISEFPSDAACELRNLHTLHLELNSFHSFPECFTKMESLRKLFFSGNKITKLPETIGIMTQLEELRIANNSLKSLPDSFCQLRNLKVLSLRYNSIDMLPKRFGDLVGLGGDDSELNLEENPWRWPPKNVINRGFDEIKSYIEGGERRASTSNQSADAEKPDLLRAMSTASCRQRWTSSETIWPFSEEMKIENLSRTSVKIDARGLLLKHLPKTITEFKDLNRLYLDRNILEFDNNLCKLLKNCCLKVLAIQSQGKGKVGISHSMHSNRLNKIPDGIVNLGHLQELYLADNVICRISKDITYLKLLKVLELSQNKLEIFPEELCELDRLEYLGLSNNKISKLPDAIGLMKNLKILRLSYNRLQHLPETICQLKSLQMLSLRNNHLSYLPLKLYEMKGLLNSEMEYYISYLDCDMKSGLYVDNNSKLKFPSDNATELDTEEIFGVYDSKLKLDGEAFQKEYKRIVKQYH